MTIDLAVVSGADANFFPLLRGMVGSLRDTPQGRDFSLHIFDIGLTETQRRWLQVQGAAVHRLPDAGIAPPHLPAHFRLLLSRCRLPELLPGHEVYLWIDADAWVQQWEAIEAFAHGARRAGFALCRETDPAYDRRIVLAAHGPSFAMFGPEGVARLRTAGSTNAGVFAGRADAPHWQAWRRKLEPKIAATGDPNLLFLLDQTALALVCGGELPAAEIPAIGNWVANLALPMVSQDARLLVRPLPPHEPLGIIHQTGHTKRGFFPLRRVAGGAISRNLAYQAHSQLAPDDYVSPGLQIVLPDECFPNLVRGDQSASDWPYLRRGLPHAWLVDRRMPGWGFLNRDEAHILYSTALGFVGRPALEIGCLMGWSACHMALAGVDLDIVDPLLADGSVRDSVQNALQAARFPGRVTLVPGRSPDAIRQLAANRPNGWSLFFIDGDHDGDAPLEDAKACERHAAADAAIVFHDLASPFVARAVAYLKARGWNTRVFHTAQIMAVAWRGAARPIAHQPDPRVDWQIPDHVMPLLSPPAIGGAPDAPC